MRKNIGVDETKFKTSRIQCCVAHRELKSADWGAGSEGAAGGQCHCCLKEVVICDNSNRRQLGNAFGITGRAGRGAIVEFRGRPNLKLQQNSRVEPFDVGKTHSLFSVIDFNGGMICIS